MLNSPGAGCWLDRSVLAGGGWLLLLLDHRYRRRTAGLLHHGHRYLPLPQQREVHSSGLRLHPVLHHRWARFASSRRAKKIVFIVFLRLRINLRIKAALHMSPQIKSPSPSHWTRSMTSWPETCASCRTEPSPSPSPSTTPASTWTAQTSPSTGTSATEAELWYPGSWRWPTPTSAPAPSSPRWWSRRWSQTRPATSRLTPPRPPAPPPMGLLQVRQGVQQVCVS